VVRFYNKRGTTEQWIKEGKSALTWTRLSCHDFVDNQVRLQLFVLAYNLGNFLRRLALPKSVKKWSLRTLREKLIKIGVKVVKHSRHVVSQMAEVVVPRPPFRQILERISRLRANQGLVRQDDRQCDENPHDRGEIAGRGASKNCRSSGFSTNWRLSIPFREEYRPY